MVQKVVGIAFTQWIYYAEFKVDLWIQGFYSIPLQGTEQHGQFEYLYVSGTNNESHEKKSYIKTMKKAIHSF